MNQEILERWQTTIDNSCCTTKQKKMLLQYVSNMLQKEAVIIINSAHLAQLVGINEDVMNKMIVSPKYFYRSFTIPKRAGGVREISAPYPSLMMVQQWIYKTILLPQTEFSESATGFIPGKSIVDNAKPHIGGKELLKMDIKDFFPSVGINRVISVFRGLGYYHQIAYYLASLCCEDSHLPQGAPTSPILSNIVTKRMDYRLKHLAEKYGLVYTRYADDLTFSGQHIPVKFISIVTSIVEDEGFRVNEKKTEIKRKYNRKIITGVSVSSDKPCIPREMKRWIRQQMYYINQFGLKSHMNRCRLQDPFYALRMNGYLAYWKSVEPDNPFLLRCLNRKRV